MSRIGKQPVVLPAGTTVTREGDQFVVKGSKGTLLVPAFAGVDVEIKENEVVLGCEDIAARPHYGLLRALLSNAVTGVSEGWTRNLELHGVGMRATTTGTSLNLSLGFSHPVVFDAPEGVTFTVTKNVVAVAGIDKQLVGETAAEIRRLRKPEPYKGKGIRYSDEYVRRKAGKTGKTASATK
jgi:large subunit ribosomal protein L6